ncbi:uncharacterized protein [Montipora foliosa]|uniref:uncharacterized protein n=1 Tax=Montipora foliosa TaxID=591990 RepID=UPI0035F1B6A4
MTPGFKPFTILRSLGRQSERLANNYISYASNVRRIRQQLWFNHRCKDLGLVPSGLRLKSPLNTQEAIQIVKATCRRLIRARINDRHRRLNHYNNRLQQRLHKLKQQEQTGVEKTCYEVLLIEAPFIDGTEINSASAVKLFQNSQARPVFRLKSIFHLCGRQTGVEKTCYEVLLIEAPFIDGTEINSASAVKLFQNSQARPVFRLKSIFHLCGRQTGVEKTCYEVLLIEAPFIDGTEINSASAVKLFQNSQARPVFRLKSIFHLCGRFRTTHIADVGDSSCVVTKQFYVATLHMVAKGLQN